MKATAAAGAKEKCLSLLHPLAAYLYSLHIIGTLYLNVHM